MNPSNSESTPLLNWHSFQNKCSQTWNDAWNKLEDSQNTLKYAFISEAFMPLTAVAMGVSSVTLEIMDRFGKTTSELIAAIPHLTEGSVKSITNSVKSIFFIAQVGSLFSATKENIENRREAKKLGVKDEIILADLEAVSLVSSYLFIPEAIVDVAQGFLASVSPMLLQAVAVCTVVGAFFSIADIAHSGVSHKATSDLLIELKRSRHLTFLLNYKPTKKTKYEELSDKFLKSNVKKIKLKLGNDSTKVDQLTTLLQSANEAFIRDLQDKIIKNPKIMTTHFQIIVRREEGVEPERQDASGKTILASINQKIFGKIGETAFISKRAEIVKNLKRQLNVKRRFNIASIFTKIVGLAPVLMMTALALGATCPPLAPIAGALAGVVGVITLATLCYKFYRTYQFTTAMELLVSTQ